MPVCMVLRNVECPASGVGEYHLPLCGVTTFHGHVMCKSVASSQAFHDPLPNRRGRAWYILIMSGHGWTWLGVVWIHLTTPHNM